MEDFKLIGHSHQIADTGDYDGCYEITNGKVSIFTTDDDDEALEPIVKALNDSGAKFYLDDSDLVDNYILRHDISELKETNKTLVEALERIKLIYDNVEDSAGVIARQAIDAINAR